MIVARSMPEERIDDRAIEYYSRRAEYYDLAAEAFHCISPQTIFGFIPEEYKLPGQKLLDIGCGTGLSSEPFFRAGFSVYGVDGAPGMLEQFRAKGFARQLDLIDLNRERCPYGNGFFDQAVACGVMCFFPDPSFIISEASRVIKRGGLFSFSYKPFDTDKRPNLIASSPVAYRHAPGDVKSLLIRSGFSLIKSKFYPAFRSCRGYTVYHAVTVAQKK
ncbi:MAG: class I SAM-dependent methyltransferase [Candidatus Falkowbacteria bacterium]